MTNEEEKEPNKIIFTTRMIVGAISMILIIFCPMVRCLKIVLGVCSYLILSYEVIWNAVKNISHGEIFDENFLMLVASIGAFAIGDIPESIAVMLFYDIGEYLQDLAVDKSRGNIIKLMDIRSDKANLLRDDKVTEVSPEEVKVGEIILVKVGERIPLDGVVVSGKSYLDTKALTGESVPTLVFEGESVLSGSIVNSGVLSIKVTKLYKDSTVSKILDMVQNAESKKTGTEKFITKFAKIYTPIVVGIALIVAVVPPLLNFGTYSMWIYKALSFLIVSCPCALVISIPVSFFAGIGGLAKVGVLVKGANYLEALKDIDTVVFDKTGTLTYGNFEVKEIIPSGETVDNVLRFASIAEQYSTHPIAISILKKYDKKSLVSADITEVSGLGIEAKTKDDVIYVGNKKYMSGLGFDGLSEYDFTTVYVAVNDKFIGAIIIADTIRENAFSGIKNIKMSGVSKTCMLSGDKLEIARQVSNTLGLDMYKAELLPDEKVIEFESIMEKSIGKVAFVGDGINDAPVLTRADIGFAMGGIGSDSAIESADVVIMNDDISTISSAMGVSKKTCKIVKQNIVFSLATKIIIMILSLFGITNIWFAIIGDVGVALLAVLNATRALHYKKEN